MRQRIPRPATRSTALPAVLATAATLSAIGSAGPARAERAFDSAVYTMPVDGYGLVLVDRARTPERFEFGLRAQGGFSYTPLRLNLNDARMGYSEQPFRVIEQQYTLDVGFFLGLFDFLSIAAAVPVAVGVYDSNAAGEPVVPAPPNPTNPAAMAPTSATGLLANQPRQNLGISRAGLRDPRLSLKLRFYGGRYFEIGSVLEATLPLGDSSSFLGEHSATFRPRLVLGALIKRVDVLLSFGGIVRETATLNEPSPPMGTEPPIRLQVAHELTFGAAIVARAHRTFGLGVEAAGTLPVAGEATQPTATALGSLFILPHEKLRLSLSGGGGLISSSARNAEGRVLLGMSYSLSPRLGGLL
ncbi:MAG: hypothetical protein U1A78_09940 [Polyangia bacterium]